MAAASRPHDQNILAKGDGRGYLHGVGVGSFHLPPSLQSLHHDKNVHTGLHLLALHKILVLLRGPGSVGGRRGKAGVGAQQNVSFLGETGGERVVAAR